MTAGEIGESPELSVVVVTWNCRDLVLRCLETLERERELLSLEVVLVDNASEDGTLEAVTARFPWVVSLAAGGNIGFSAANNLGLGHTTGGAVLLLNPDTEVAPGALSLALRRLMQEPALGMLGSRLLLPDGSLDHACKRGFPTVASSFWYFAGLARLFPTSPRFAAYTAGHVGALQESRVDAVNGAFMLARRAAIDAVGALDEGFWMYGEDLDWCYRFWAAGWPVLYFPDAVVIHVKGGSSSKLRSRKTNVAFHLAMWRFYELHYAPADPPLLRVAVWTAVRAKLAFSVARNAVKRRAVASGR